MKTVDVIAWALVATAAGLGIAACAIFSSSLALPLASALVSLF